MDSIWNVLGLEPTRDVSAIRRAYTQKTLDCHPEEDPEGFMELQKAYQAARNHAESNAMDAVVGGTDIDGSDAGEAYLKVPDAGDEDWLFAGDPRHATGPDPYADHEAIRNFLDLYTGKQRKDQKRWLDYFTSDAFLDVAWDWHFTALLLEHVTRLEKEYPVNREFLIWLCVAYQFTVHRAVYRNPDGSERTEFRFRVREGACFQDCTEAQFRGQEFVFEIATRGPAPKYPKGNELAVLESFTEYRRLISMAEENVWGEQEIGECSEIIGHYAAIYITDKCQQRGDMDYERHPAGLRLMTHFFRREGLPEELYRIAWQRLNLETAVMGREKIFYGSLRELILERMPELTGRQREKFTELRAAFHTYAVSTCKLNGVNARATEEDIQKTDDLFAREDFQRALSDRRFVEEEMLHTWVNEDRCDYYLKKVIQFYTEHGTAPCAGRVIDRAGEMLKCQKIEDRLQKDRETEIPEDGMTLRNSAFFRHWLNTGFYQARDPESGSGLLEYLNEELPYLPEWSKGFLGVTGKEIIPRSVTCAVGGDVVEVRFHLRYMEFLLNQEPVYRPCLGWESVESLTDGDTFFFCLPITVTACDQYEVVKEKILGRLENTAAPEDGCPFIAACLAERICSLPGPGWADPEWGEEDLEWDREGEEPPRIRSLSPESMLPFELFDEDTEHLYGCSWIEQSQVLQLFEQLPIGRQQIRWDGADAEGVVTLARQMLEETVAPPRIPMELLANLPDAVYAMPDFSVVSRNRDRQPFWSRPVELSGKAVTNEETGTGEAATGEGMGTGNAVTREKLEELLNQFADDRIERLELSWNITPPVGEEQDYDARRSLVFMKGSGGYVCLYFDDFRAKSFALLERPELYGRMEHNPAFVPFRHGRLFDQVIHRSFSSIRRRLDIIFQQVSWPNNVDYMAGNIWDYAINVSSGRSKYNLDKQLLADFPMERAHNRPDAPLYFFLYPDSAACVDDGGSVEMLEIDQPRRGRLQQMITGFLKGGFRRLRLTFGGEAGRRRHIAVLQDNGRFLLAWLSEEKRTVKYHVADDSTYLDVEGKKYPKDTFQGRSTPAYLIHSGVMPLRNELELLLANLDHPARITDQFARYADEKPVKARSYEELWAELVGDTL